jgi:energy-coupling factor transport system permease protein
MILRLIPQAAHRAQTISAAQTGLRPPAGTKRQKLIQKLDETTLLMSWMMENSLETAASMRARAFGKKKRTSFHVFKFSISDFILVVLLLLLGAASVFAIYSFKFDFYPYLTEAPFPLYSLAVYSALLLFPLLCEGRERLLWIFAG